MRLDVDPFPVNTVGFEAKRILVCSDQVETTKAENVVVSDELWKRMMKPRSHEAGVWKENVMRKSTRKMKPTSSIPIDKYTRQQQRDACEQVSWAKRGRFRATAMCPRNVVLTTQ
jgi:hypothetical protein